MNQVTQYQIFIGYNDSQTKKAFVSEEEFVQLVTEFFEKQNINFSIMHGKGGYLYEDENYIIEHTMIITLVGEQSLDIIKLASALSMYMNQECIMITKNNTNMRYE